MRAEILQEIKNEFERADDKIAFLNDLRKYITEQLSPEKTMPVDLVLWVPIEKVQANDYNPNAVAKTEMDLLHTSIQHDGYTQPIVTIYDKNIDKYIIVDGFHRYFVAKTKEDIKAKTLGYIPIVVINKNINDRMASTVRHNRARGVHHVTGMSNLIFQMLDNGWEDSEICNELGMDAEELLKLKHITGFSKLFKDSEYSKAWMSKRQILLAKAEKEKTETEHGKIENQTH